MSTFPAARSSVAGSISGMRHTQASTRFSLSVTARTIASRDDGLLDFWATLTVGSKNCHNEYFGGRCVTVWQRVEPGAGDVADHAAVRGAAAGGRGGQAVGSPARVQAVSSGHSGPHSLHQNLNSFCCDSKHND